MGKYTHFRSFIAVGRCSQKIGRDYYCSGVFQSRDSGAMERHSFRCMLIALGGESESIVVVRESHCVRGWIDRIAIHKGNHEALRKADSIAALRQDYRIINLSDRSEKVGHEANKAWRPNFLPGRIKYIRNQRFRFPNYSEPITAVRSRTFCSCPARRIRRGHGSINWTNVATWLGVIVFSLAAWSAIIFLTLSSASLLFQR
ncbi:hypothetical protein [Bradyrhizobium sp. BWA-3-5]|uniref:hypothetical protein n=1 Tax=Bradyrhizobium sp. BWA-3-5 TaxID=3080013 RepID=UPI00293F417E|nr:hypothetical protein [Bradyrhizobium sp. BWA-3-5]WOH64115.1 hypothetical protein RX331_26405 [Bradyrhizobium sp. BWA-3-5]WOH64232.1 hypothetical protein RX331_27145 [Bradyrhizobium sp. BWA-3-5]WOH70161.1 hypothetical protein RX331_38325 [Bradyrhizobium sp. BWA-3-5]